MNAGDAHYDSNIRNAKPQNISGELGFWWYFIFPLKKKSCPSSLSAILPW